MSAPPFSKPSAVATSLPRSALCAPPTDAELGSRHGDPSDADREEWERALERAREHTRDVRAAGREYARSKSRE